MEKGINCMVWYSVHRTLATRKHYLFVYTNTSVIYLLYIMRTNAEGIDASYFWK